MFTELKTVTTHQVALLFTDEADARDFLANPEKAQDAVRAQLAAVHANGDTPRLHDAVGMPKPARKKRAAPAKKVGGAKQKKHKADAAAKGLAYYCTECEHEPFSSAGFLARHERQVHGGAQAPAAEHESEDE